MPATSKREFDEGRWPAASETAASDQLKSVDQAEGRVTRLVYITPRGKTPLEVFRNHEQALQAAGAQRVFACERDCDRLFWAWQRQLKPQEGLSWASGYLVTPTGSRFSVSAPVSGEEVRMWVGRVPRPGAGVAHVTLVTAVASNKLTGFAATYLQIVEPKAMQTGQVLVDAKALGQGLQADGKVALYGIYFDTGKAVIKAESKPQLDEMAQALQLNPSARYFVVGHTDNVGSFEANQALSLARAQAVAAALVAPPYRVKPERLSAQGAANIAPGGQQRPGRRACTQPPRRTGAAVTRRQRLTPHPPPEHRDDSACAPTSAGCRRHDRVGHLRHNAGCGQLSARCAWGCRPPLAHPLQRFGPDRLQDQ